MFSRTMAPTDGQLLTGGLLCRREVAEMIRVTRLDRSEFLVNAEFIQTVESKPDTHIVLFNGHSYVVLEKSDEVLQQILDYRRTAYGGVPRPPLSLVRD